MLNHIGIGKECERLQKDTQHLVADTATDVSNGVVQSYGPFLSHQDDVLDADQQKEKGHCDADGIYIHCDTLASITNVQ